MDKTRNLNGTATSGNVSIQIGSNAVSAEPQIKLKLFWQDLSAFNKTSQFLFCCAGIFFFYLLYGFLLELIFTLDGLKPYSWFVTLMQFGYYSLFGWAENFFSKSKGRNLAANDLSNSIVGTPCSSCFPAYKSQLPENIAGYSSGFLEEQIKELSEVIFFYAVMLSLTTSILMLTLTESYGWEKWRTYLPLELMWHKYMEKFVIPMKTYLLLGGLTLGTVGFSNTSLQHLNYPTQVIFKCCKLIPVMIGGILIQRKTYGVLDFLAAITMCTGLGWFTLADSYTSPNFNTLGVIMISLALMCDAVIGNVQEKAMNNFNASNAEVVLYSYSLGFMYLLILLVLTGKFFNAFYFCLNNPVQTYGYGLLFSASGYLGVQIVLTLVKTCGALAAATVTTCRKAFSIFLSFIFFTKPFTIGYFWSGLLVLLGIYLNIYAKKKKNTSLKDLIPKCLSWRTLAQGKKTSNSYLKV